jgi:uncharacterized membrane protein YbhN (UPF0104 family)
MRDARFLARTLRLFAPESHARVRRATDLVALVPALLLLVFLASIYPSTFERSLARFLSAFPGWLDPVWGLLIAVMVAWLGVLVVSCVVRVRVRLLGHAALAAVAALGLAACGTRIALGSWPSLSDALGLHSGQPPYPAVRLAMGAAALLTFSGDLVKPARSLNRWLLTLAAVSVAIGGSASPYSVAGGVLAAIAAACTVRLALGSAAGRPGLDDVQAALVELGVDAHSLELDERQFAGVIRLHALDASGAPLTVKIYGRDAYDTQLLSKAWRAIWYRDDGPAAGLSRAQVVEHEAFVTLLARNAGVPVPAVVTAGATATQDALLVLRGRGQSLAELPRERIDAALLARAWQCLGKLASANIAHLQIDASVVVVEGDEVGLRDLTGATVAPDEIQLSLDRAQLLATTAAVAGTDAAIAAAHAALGSEGLTALLPFLQPAAFGSQLRRSLKEAEVNVDELRTQAGETVGTTPPGLVRLRRVTWGTVIQLGLLVFATSAVFSFVSGVDFHELASEVRNAAWGWIVVAFVVAQLPRLAQSVATLGTVPTRLPFGPVYAMQLATGYMNLALPSGIARMAVNVRFFQRLGLPGAMAVTSGTIDSFANNALQATILLLILIFTDRSLTLNVQAPSSGSLSTLGVILAFCFVLLVGCGIALLVSQKLRTRVMAPIRHWVPQIRNTLTALRSPVKVAQVILGNLAAEILFATALGLFAYSLGYAIPLADLLVINMSVSLFATFIPIPGGIGVVEGGLMVGLNAAGMPETTALAAALLYRISTFYLPPIAGWFSLRWLQRNGYL